MAREAASTHNLVRTRSVDNLQRVYTVVISLSIAESLRRLLTPLADSGAWPDLSSVIAVLSLLVTIVPFYHGTNRYLDSTSVTGERTARSGALMIDFVANFAEGIVFFALATLIGNPVLFFSLLGALFFFDSAWVGFTTLTATDKNPGPSYAPWFLVNVAAGFLLLLSMWSNLLEWSLWRSDQARIIAVGVICAARAVFDYVTVWKFYLPPTAEDEYFMPDPLPARPPKRSRRNRA